MITCYLYRALGCVRLRFLPGEPLLYLTLNKLKFAQRTRQPHSPHLSSSTQNRLPSFIGLVVVIAFCI